MSKHTDPRLGARILGARQDLRLTRKELAAKVQLKENTLFKIEKRGDVPSRPALERIFNALNLDSAEVNRWLPDSLGERPDAFQGTNKEPQEVIAHNSPGSNPDGIDQYKAALRVAMRSIRRSADDIHTLETNLFEIVERVITVWNDAVDIPYIPKHGPDHNLRMVEVLCKHFKSELRDLARDEIRILLAAIWLHDLGLALREPEIKPIEERARLDTYETLSAAYIDAHSHELGLSYEPDKRIASNLCLYHRNELALEALEIDSRQKALLALLRLADLMAVSPDRVKGRDLVTYKFVPRDMAADVLRSLFVAKINRDDRHCMLLAEMVRDGDWGEPKLKLLSAKIQQDVQLSLDRIKATLVIELRTNLFFASVQTVAVPADFDKAQLRAMLDRIGTASSPNAARVFNDLISSLRTALAEGTFESQVDHIRSGLAFFCKVRECHAQIQNVADALTEVLDSQNDNDGPEAKVTKMFKIVDDFQKGQQAAHATIAETAKRTFSAPARFVVFGYSSSVLTALKALSSDPRHLDSHVYVCECRNKCLYFDAGNSVEYSDGVEYARSIREMGWNNVHLVSDASICYYLQGANEGCEPGQQSNSKSSHSLQTYVLLGADGVHPDGSVSGTIGTTTVAAAAKSFNVGVYVLAEGGKVRSQIEYGGKERENEWLTTDQRIITICANERIAIERPLNEKVPAFLISKFITEAGVLTVDEFKQNYRTKVAANSTTRESDLHAARGSAKESKRSVSAGRRPAAS